MAAEPPASVRLTLANGDACRIVLQGDSTLYTGPMPPEMACLLDALREAADWLDGAPREVQDRIAAAVANGRGA